MNELIDEWLIWVTDGLTEWMTGDIDAGLRRVTWGIMAVSADGDDDGWRRDERNCWWWRTCWWCEAWVVLMEDGWWEVEEREEEEVEACGEVETEDVEVNWGRWKEGEKKHVRN